MRLLHGTGAILLAALLGAAPSMAAAEQSVRDQLRHCIQINGAVERLACFERLAQAELSRPESPDTDARSQGRQEEADPRQFTSTIAALEQRPHGEHIFHLANGQVWTETQPGRLRYEPGSEVLLQRTFMGSWMMRVEGGRTIRVRRVE